MKKILQRIALYARGLFYFLFYYIPYKVIMRPRTRDTHLIKTITVDDISYKLRINARLGGISQDLYINSLREYPNALYFKNYIGTHAHSIATYIGIGANIGYYALLTRDTVRKAGGRGNIYALEPVKSTFEELRFNIKLNKVRDILALNIGAGNRDGTAEMIIMPEHNLSKIKDDTSTVNDTTQQTEIVSLYTLHTLFSTYNIPKRDVILRCDIEGYEYNLIIGNMQFLKQLRNAHIIMEFHAFFLHAKKSIEVLRSLQAAGYKLQQVISCEPAYFLRMPWPIRKLLTALFLFQHNGEALGKIERYRSIDDLVADLQDEQNALYVYPHLHFYFSKP